MSDLNEMISQIPFSSVSVSAVTWMLKMETSYTFFKRKKEKCDQNVGWRSAEYIGKAEGLPC